MLSLNHISETFLDFPDNESLAVIVFFNGCIHNCPGCHNPELQVVDETQMYTPRDLCGLIEKSCVKNRTTKVVFSGGDPFYSPEDIICLSDLLESKGIQVCIYTGYTIEKVKFFYENYKKSHMENIKYATYVKCGVYIENLRDNAMGKYDDKFILASKNQAFYAQILNKDFEKISENHILYF